MPVLYMPENRSPAPSPPRQQASLAAGGQGGFWRGGGSALPDTLPRPGKISVSGRWRGHPKCL